MSEETAERKVSPRKLIQRIKSAEKRERYKAWIRDAEDALRRYECQEEDGSSGYSYAGLSYPRGSSSSQLNIHFSNTEILHPAIFSSMPRPMVRARNDKRSQLTDAVSKVLQKNVAYNLDMSSAFEEFSSAALSMAITGLAVMRVRYDPKFVESEMAGMEETLDVYKTLVRPEAVPPKSFVWPISSRWMDVPWVAYKHYMTIDMIEDDFGEDVAEKIEKHIEEKSAEASVNEDDRICVYEIWIKKRKCVYFCCEEYTDGFLRTIEGDPLEIEGFFDCAEPVMLFSTPGKLYPATLLSKYRKQADEIDEISRRISALVRMCRYRIVYDATLLPELQSLLDAAEGDMVPASNTAGLVDRGGIASGLWAMPIDQIVTTIATLSQQREACKQQVYETIGLSDIERGISDPAETLGAQKIKARNAGSRLGKMQRAFESMCRDVIRKMVEIIADNIPIERMVEISGEEYPSMMDVMQMPPEEQQGADMLTIEQLDQAIREDITRSFSISIESRSLVSQDMQEDARNIASASQAVSTMLAQVMPLVQQGVLDFEVAKALCISVARKFEMGQDIEDALIAMHQPAPPPPEEQAQPSGPTPEELQIKTQELMLKVQEAKDRQELESAKLQLQVKDSENRHSLEIEKLRTQIAMKRVDMLIEQGKLDDKAIQRETETAMRSAELGADAAEAVMDAQEFGKDDSYNPAKGE